MNREETGEYYEERYRVTVDENKRAEAIGVIPEGEFVRFVPDKKMEEATEIYLNERDRQVLINFNRGQIKEIECILWTVYSEDKKNVCIGYEKFQAELKEKVRGD